MERRKYFRLVRGASCPAPQGVVKSLGLGNGANLDDFRDALLSKRVELELSPILRASAVEVFAYSEVQTPIDRKPTFDNYGESSDDPLIVRVPEVWYQLEDASTRAAFAGTRPRPAPLPEGDTVEALLNVAYDANRDVLAGFVPSQLVAYENQASVDANTPLSVTLELASRGRTRETPLIVMVPQREVYGAPPVREFRNIVEVVDESDLEELRRYQEQGRLISDNCKDFCSQILDKIDHYYKHENGRPLQFMCVQGSSGTGKSQLAFALGGRRPYFYWLGVRPDQANQALYRNFTSISNAFIEFVRRDLLNDAEALIYAVGILYS